MYDDCGGIVQTLQKKKSFSYSTGNLERENNCDVSINTVYVRFVCEVTVTL